MKLSVSDVLVTATTLIGSVALLWLYSMDVNSITSRIGVRPLGTVVFKRLSATRRPSDGLGWERMRNNGPVYDADTLRTAGFSEASVFFDDGTSLDLQENSMLKLNFGGEVKALEFLEGEITVGGGNAGTRYAISSTAGEIQIGKESRATFSREGNSVSIEVSDGDATLVRPDGSSQFVGTHQELTVDVSDGSASIVARPIVQVEPERNARLLSLADSRQNTASVAFAWQADGDSKPRDRYTLEISPSKDFSVDVTEFGVAGSGTTESLTAGTWYWRVADGSGLRTPARKFTLTIGGVCQPAYPPDGSVYAYRRSRPEIRFSWTPTEEASAYLFELSREPSFDKPIRKTRVAATSLTLDDIEEGSWYWRVGAIHGYTEIGPGRAAPARSVTIAKSGEMNALELGTPFDGFLYQIQELEGKGISFAWKPEKEAVSYELLVSETKDLSNPEMTIPSISPYTRLIGDLCGTLTEAGTRYWGVRWIDAEGNSSPSGAARKLNGIDGSIAIRPVFPPDGYRIADSLAGNARFSWKTNIAAKTIFVVSRTADFSDVVFQKQVSSENIIGEKWGSGLYWWKVKTLNTDGSLFMETPARAFAIVDPLPGATLADPVPGKPFFLREGDKRTFSWNPVDGADFYSVALYEEVDGYSKPIYENGFLQDTAFEYALGDRDGGRCRLDIQAFTLESENSTRIIGYIGENEVNYQRISFLELDAPSPGSVIGGLEARRKGVTLAYRAKNPPERQEFVLYKDGTERISLEDADGTGTRWRRKRLSPGSYSWTVRGELAGVDISARNTAAFQVLDIPPLPPAQLVRPAMGTIIGPVELRESRSIYFDWDPVANANRYILTVLSGGTTNAVLRIDLDGKTEYVLGDLSVLGKGEFSWIVEAQAWDEADELEQSGTAASSSFTIELPEVKKATVKKGKALYGR